jgi:hypothetical protein
VLILGALILAALIRLALVSLRALTLVRRVGLGHRYGTPEQG